MTALNVTILGCGSSGGVPRIGNDWGACDPENPKNRRTRCGIFVEAEFSAGIEPLRFLIDTPTDLRDQLVREQIGSVDAVLFTHEHADQTHGIDDVRVLAYMQRKRMPVYGSEETMTVLSRRFDYCFKQKEGSPYPPILETMDFISAYNEFEIGEGERSISILPLDQDHGSMRSFGFRIGDFAYCNDMVDLPDKTLSELKGLDCLVIDALRYDPHPTHAHLQKSLDWIEELAPKKAVLTNMHIDLDYETVTKETPDNVFAAYDGMKLHTQ